MLNSCFFFPLCLGTTENTRIVRQYQSNSLRSFKEKKKVTEKAAAAAVSRWNDVCIYKATYSFWST